MLRNVWWLERVPRRARSGARRDVVLPSREGDATKPLCGEAVRRGRHNNQTERARDLGEVREEEAYDRGGAGSFPYS
jgi:hypothetical protein